jgi:hypothetical protein
MKYYIDFIRYSKSIFEKSRKKRDLSKFCIDFENIQIFRKFILFYLRKKMIH